MHRYPFSGATTYIFLRGRSFHWQFARSHLPLFWKVRAYAFREAYRPVCWSYNALLRKNLDSVKPRRDCFGIVIGERQEVAIIRRRDGRDAADIVRGNGVPGGVYRCAAAAISGCFVGGVDLENAGGRRYSGNAGRKSLVEVISLILGHFFNERLIVLRRVFGDERQVFWEHLYFPITGAFVATVRPGDVIAVVSGRDGSLSAYQMGNKNVPQAGHGATAIRCCHV